MKSRAIHILGLLLALMLFTGCSGTIRSASLSGNDISEYTIVYDPSAPDYFSAPPNIFRSSSASAPASSSLSAKQLPVICP